MSFTQDSVKKLAHLARISMEQSSNNTPADQQLQSFTTSIAADLNNIINWIAQINQVDTSNVQPMSHPLEAKQRLRADLVTELDDSKNLQAIAPANSVTSGLYLVPQVVE